MTNRFVYLGLLMAMLCFTGINAYSQDQSFIEAKMSDFIRKIYDSDDDLQIKFGNVPARLRGKSEIKNISFAKVPDAKGDGVCLVEVDGKNGKDRSFYVPFRAIKKSRVFVLTHSGKRGDVLRPESVTTKEAQFNEKKPGYPSKLEDIVGRVLKKDVAGGTVVSYSMLDEPIAIQKGEIVNVIAENRRLVVQTKGKAMEKGKVGDSIRVRNASSEKEILGKVVDGSTVSVKF